MISDDARQTMPPEQTAPYTRVITDADVALFALITGDQHPLHLDADSAEASPFARRVVPVGLITGVIEAALAEAFPRGVAREVTLTFPAPAFIDEALEARLAPEEAAACHWRGAVTVTRPDGVVVAQGAVTVTAEAQR